MSFKRSLGIGLLLAALPCMAGMAAPAWPMAEGQLAYRLGRYNRAESLFAKAGKTGEARLWKGKAEYRLGREEGAIADWKFVSREPATRAEAGAELDSAKQALKSLALLLDRYGRLKAAEPASEWGASAPSSASDAWRDLADGFDALSRQDPDSLVGRRAALMAADCLGVAGDAQEALKRFEQAKDRLPLVADWALWRMASLEPINKDADLQLIIERFPDSPLLPAARLRLAEDNPDAGSRQAALEAIAKANPSHPAGERALYLLSRIKGSRQASRLLAYWNRYPDGRYLDEVVKSLQGQAGLSQDTWYRIGSYEYFASDYGPAVLAFRHVPTAMALYRMGRAYWGTNDLDRAIAALKTVPGKDPTLAAKAYETIGEIESQRDRWPAAAAAYRQASSHGGEAGVTALWKLSRIYHEQHKEALARQLEQKIINSAPWSEEATTILWQGFWNAYEAGRTAQALHDGQVLVRHNPQHPDALAAQYWLGRLYEKHGNTKAALSAYNELIGRAPSTYYGWRATWRKQVLTGGGSDPWFETRPGRTVTSLPIAWQDLLAPEARELLSGEPGTPLPKEMLEWPESVRELVFLRQFDVAVSFAGADQSPNLKAWLSYLQRHYRDAIRLEQGEPRLDYPLGFAGPLIDAASHNGIDPLLLAALVREESRFDPGIKSWVGATGLAQLMPSTADWVVKHVPEAAGKPLTDPSANLHLGAWYLAYTHSQFNGNSMDAVAAYNGGPGAVAKWHKNFHGQPDEFVETIPYGETRLYVKKVFTSYWNYVKLYGGS